MISARLMGGLGNYMFQIAAAEALAKDLRTESVFDFSSAGQSQKHIGTYANNIFRNVKNGTPNPKYLYNEKKFSYDRIPYADDLYIFGYFQSEKYFAHQAEHIKSLFNCRNAHLEGIIKQFGYTCSIHVRRGDYLKYPNKHTQPSLEYYQLAIDHIKRENPLTKFLVFSDDIEWCKTVFDKDFIFIEGLEDWQELTLMSMCDNNIITNSTFSWWAAWLGEDPGKTIIAPATWFGPEGPQDQQDIIPTRWRTLK